MPEFIEIECDPFLYRIPDQENAPKPLAAALLRSVDRSVRGVEIQQAYEAGFNGVFLGSMGWVAAQGYRYHRDRFRRMANRAAYRWAEDGMYRWKAEADPKIESEGYLASKDAFAAWKRDKDPSVDDWLFRFLQNSGNCVGASWTEMLQGLIGTRAMDPANNEVMRYLMAMWVYMFRGSCGQGWYGSACAARTKEFGYAFSKFYDLPDLGSNFDFDGEQRTEDLTVSTWCRRQPADFIQHVKDQNWFFADDAIYEFTGGPNEVRELVKLKAQMHHGSTATGGSRPGTVKRIGGHQQTMFGARWDDASIRWLNDKVGRDTFSQDNFPCFNGQTWGPEANNDPSYWNVDLWGPMPEGFFICPVNQQLDYFGDAYVYLPKMTGILNPNPPGPVPPGPPSQRVWPRITGFVSTDESEISTLTVQVTDDVEPGDYRYLAKPAGSGRVELVPRYV